MLVVVGAVDGREIGVALEDVAVDEIFGSGVICGKGGGNGGEIEMVGRAGVLIVVCEVGAVIESASAEYDAGGDAEGGVRRRGRECVKETN